MFMSLLGFLVVFGGEPGFKAVEPFLDQREKCVPVHLQVMRGDHRLVNLLGQNLLARGSW